MLRARPRARPPNSEETHQSTDGSRKCPEQLSEELALLRPSAPRIRVHRVQLPREAYPLRLKRRLIRGSLRCWSASAIGQVGSKHLSPTICRPRFGARPLKPGPCHGMPLVGRPQKGKQHIHVGQRRLHSSTRMSWICRVVTVGKPGGRSKTGKPFTFFLGRRY